MIIFINKNRCEKLILVEIWRMICGVNFVYLVWKEDRWSQTLCSVSILFKQHLLLFIPSDGRRFFYHFYI